MGRASLALALVVVVVAGTVLSSSIVDAVDKYGGDMLPREPLAVDAPEVVAAAKVCPTHASCALLRLVTVPLQVSYLASNARHWIGFEFCERAGCHRANLAAPVAPLCVCALPPYLRPSTPSLTVCGGRAVCPVRLWRV
jgi:hypothetical protein